MSDVQVYTGKDARQATIERMSAAPPPSSSLMAHDLEGQFKIAAAIANATEMVPRGYRRQPGAVLLALMWAQQHGLDLLTTMQGVAFIEGKAVVDATMQRALAKQAGYELRIGLREDAATVEVLQHGQGLGAATYSMADAQRAGLTGKKNWQQNPEDMLVARATTRAVRRFAPDVLLGMAVSDDIDEAPASPPELPPEPPPAPAAVLVPDDEPTPPEAVEEAGATPPAVAPPPQQPEVEEPPPSTSAGRWRNPADMRAELRARGITVPEAVRAAHDIATELGVEPPSGSMDSIYRYPDQRLVEEFAQWAAGRKPAA